MHTTRTFTRAVTLALACALPAVGIAADRKGEQIELQSYSFGAATSGKTGGQNQMQSNDARGKEQQKKGGSPAPTESMSLNFGKVKSGTPDGPNQVTPPQQPPQPGGMLVPAVQKVREPAARTQNTGGANPGESKSMTYGPGPSGFKPQDPATGQMGSSTPKAYDMKEKKK